MPSSSSARPSGSQVSIALRLFGVQTRTNGARQRDFAIGHELLVVLQTQIRVVGRIGCFPYGARTRNETRIGGIGPRRDRERRRIDAVGLRRLCGVFSRIGIAGVAVADHLSSSDVSTGRHDVAKPGRPGAVVGDPAEARRDQIPVARRLGLEDDRLVKAGPAPPWLIDHERGEFVSDCVYVFPKNVIIPRGRKELLKKLGHNELLSKGAIERRMVESVQVAVILNEKQASVLFPTQKGETDMNMMFFSPDSIFHEWCLDYFRYRWYGSDIFDESEPKRNLNSDLTTLATLKKYLGMYHLAVCVLLKLGAPSAVVPQLQPQSR